LIILDMACIIHFFLSTLDWLSFADIHVRMSFPREKKPKKTRELLDSAKQQGTFVWALRLSSCARAQPRMGQFFFLSFLFYLSNSVKLIRRKESTIHRSKK
jgi:hypothetical protein